MDLKRPIEFSHYRNDWQLRDAKLRPLLKIDVMDLDNDQLKATAELLTEIARLLNHDTMREAVMAPAAFAYSSPTTEGVEVKMKQRGRPRRAA